MLAKSSERGSGSLTCSVSRLRRRARGHALNSDAPIRGAVAFPVARKSRQVSGHAESNKIITDIPIGKYMVCPLAKPQADGGFTATVSIGTGRGNAAHARVMRFAPLFETSEAALRYATSEGLNWARQQPTRSASRPQAARGAPGLSIA
jgi:hypothetical protein